MTKTIKILLISLLIVAILSMLVIPGCSDNEASPETTAPLVTPGQQELQQVLTNALAAMKKMNTCTFYIYTGTGMETTGGSQPGKADFKSTMTGAINHITNQVCNTISVNLDGDIKWANAVSHNLSEEIYLLDNSLYVHQEIVPIGKQWLKTPFSDEMKDVYVLNAVSYQLAPLESVRDLKIKGYQILDGTECYVLTMTPDASVIMGWLVEDLPAQLSYNMTIERVAKILKDISYTIWIARDTGLLKNMDANFRLEMKYDDFNALEATTFDKFTMDITVSLKIFDYNKPVSIVLPPEAAGALEISPGTL
jgi:hypothetical protein